MAADLRRIFVVWHGDWTLNFIVAAAKLGELAANPNSWDEDFYSCLAHIWILHTDRVKPVGAGRRYKCKHRWCREYFWARANPRNWRQRNNKSNQSRFLNTAAHLMAAILASSCLPCGCCGAICASLKHDLWRALAASEAANALSPRAGASIWHRL